MQFPPPQGAPCLAKPLRFWKLSRLSESYNILTVLRRSICQKFWTSVLVDTLCWPALVFTHKINGKQPEPMSAPELNVQPGARHQTIGLYTPEQRQRRDETPWTLIQGILAPVQFLIFFISLCLVLRYLMTGEGAYWADISIVVKTMALYTIMVTGAIWEKVVFGKYLFADAFFWEDVFSMLVIALHTAYLVMLFNDFGTERDRMLLALAAYFTYVINAAQFILKLRAARLQTEASVEAEKLLRVATA